MVSTQDRVEADKSDKSNGRLKQVEKYKSVRKIGEKKRDIAWELDGRKLWEMTGIVYDNRMSVCLKQQYIRKSSDLL